MGSIKIKNKGKFTFNLHQIMSGKSTLIKVELKKMGLVILQKKMNLLSHQMDDLKKSLAEEKNAMGDKHETGRAMVQLEMEKLSILILNCQSQIESLSQINETANQSVIGLGSLVTTDKNCYFISIGLGEPLTYKTQQYIPISTGAPIAQVLLGKQKNDSILYNDLKQTILSIQ